MAWFAIGLLSVALVLVVAAAVYPLIRPWLVSRRAVRTIDKEYEELTGKGFR